jgi:hypothetical protein
MCELTEGVVTVAQDRGNANNVTQPDMLSGGGTMGRLPCRAIG